MSVDGRGGRRSGEDKDEGVGCENGMKEWM